MCLKLHYICRKTFAATNARCDSRSNRIFIKILWHMYILHIYTRVHRTTEFGKLNHNRFLNPYEMLCGFQTKIMVFENIIVEVKLFKMCSTLSKYLFEVHLEL